MLRIEITLAAQRDIANHREYLATRTSARIVDQVSDNIFHSLQLIADVPQAGIVCAARPDVRYMPGHGNARNYLIYWEEMADCVQILRVIRAEQQSQRDTLGDSP